MLSRPTHGPLGVLLFFVAFGDIAVCGCSSESQRPTAESPEPEPAPRLSKAAPAERLPPADVATAEAVIGYDAVPFPPDHRAYSANRRALRALARDDVRRAISEWTSLVEVAPSYALARYNLACALSRDGRVEAAADHLRELIVKDHVRFGPRLRSDPDLASLRQSSAGAALSALASSLEDELARALDRGVAATLVGGYRFGSNDAWERRTVQGGVWVHGTQRFVPLARPYSVTVEPSVATSWATGLALVDAGRRQVVTFTGGGSEGEPAYLIIEHIAVESADASAEARLPPGHFTQVEIRHVDGGAELRYADLSFSGDLGPWAAMRPGTEFRSPDMERYFSSPRPQTRPPRQPHLTAFAFGAVTIEAPADGYRLEGNRLITPRNTIALENGHHLSQLHSVSLHPSRPLAVVVSHRSSTWADDPPTHFVDLVDIDEAVARRLSAGPGLANARFGGDGALYLALPGSPRPTVYRYADPRATDREVVAMPIAL